MATLTAWKFPSADAADTAFETLQDLDRRDLIEVLDAVVIRWPAGQPQAPDRTRGTSPAARGEPR